LFLTKINKFTVLFPPMVVASYASAWALWRFCAGIGMTIDLPGHPMSLHSTEDLVKTTQMNGKSDRLVSCVKLIILYQIFNCKKKLFVESIKHFYTVYSFRHFFLNS